MSSRNLRAEGKQAEDEAARYLLDSGFTLITRNYTRRGGEIDLIAMDGDMLVFIEVKARGAGQALPEEIMGPKKWEALRRTISAYLQEVGEAGREFRIDLIAIDPEGLRHHRDLQLED